MFRSLRVQRFTLGEYALVPLRWDDVMNIKDWRNQQMNVLRQSQVLTEEDQRNYYEQKIKPTFEAEEPRQLLFSYLYQEICIGYGGLTNIDWQGKRAEVSFLLATERITNPNMYANEFKCFLQLLKEITFSHLGFHRLFTETYDIRPVHISTLEEEGFLFEGRMREHVLINGIYIDSLIHGCLNETKKH
jgi:RimJ/RimL family protein N-acetyltransferase